MPDKRSSRSPRRQTVTRSRVVPPVAGTSRAELPVAAAPSTTANPPWMTLPTPRTRALKVYALDPSAGTYVGNVMTVHVPWERNLAPGPVGRRVAVIDYDGGNRCYYPPVDLDDPAILAMGGLDPSESDPRFHQQM